MSHRRQIRALLAVTAVVAGAGLAGCSGGDDERLREQLDDLEDRIEFLEERLDVEEARLDGAGEDATTTTSSPATTAG